MLSLGGPFSCRPDHVQIEDQQDGQGQGGKSCKRIAHFMRLMSRGQLMPISGKGMPMLPFLRSLTLPARQPRRRFFSLSPSLLVSLSLFVLTLWNATPACGRGLLIPEDRQVPPLAMVDHQVTI